MEFRPPLGGQDAGGAGFDGSEVTLAEAFPLLAAFGGIRHGGQSPAHDRSPERLD